MVWSTRHLVEDSVVRVPGPWVHRDVTANATRFHAAEIGSGPLVLLLHGFPQFWWTWRHQMVALAAAGLRAVAVDMRGYGGSDKPPRGYDLPTSAADVAGLVGALGEREAVLIGHDWGGLTGWTVAELHPELVRRLAVISAPHPLRLRDATRTNPRQAAASRYLLGFQAPRAAERWLLHDNAANVERFLRAWSAPGPWPDEEAARRYREAMLVAKAAHSSLEYVRWWFRSQFRPDGRRYGASVASEITAPVLQLHGALDRRILPSTAEGSEQYAGGPYALRMLARAGHFPHEESPDAVNRVLVPWVLGEELPVADTASLGGADGEPVTPSPPGTAGTPGRSRTFRRERAVRGRAGGRRLRVPGRDRAGRPRDREPVDRDRERDREPAGRDREPAGRDREPAGRDRDRDRSGRPRNARARDETGRPLPRTGEETPVPPDPLPLPPLESVQEADRLLAAGRPFQAHEVLEATWKVSDDPTRPVWRGLAQIAVGLTHHQRGNLVGAQALLTRGADAVATGTAPEFLDAAAVAARARGIAALLARGEDAGALAAGFRFLEG